MLYGYMGGNIFPIFTNFLTGVVAASVFIAVYYRYTPDRRRVVRVLGFEVAALSVVTIYFALALAGVTHQSRASATLVVGAMGIFFSMKLYGAGLERIRLVLRDRTGVYIPIHMVVMGTINNFLWVVYTALDRNWLMFGCCLTSCLLSVAQVVLYVVYRPDGPRTLADTTVVTTAAATTASATDKTGAPAPVRASASGAAAAWSRRAEDEIVVHVVGALARCCANHGSARCCSDVKAPRASASAAESPVFIALRSPVLSPLHRHERASPA